MNLLYLHSHDTGRWIQPYGVPVPTPNLMQLAREGHTVRNAHCAAPTCSPSRAALLTGQWAHQTGMLGLAHLESAYRQHLDADLVSDQKRRARCRGQNRKTSPDNATAIVATRDQPDPQSY